MKVEVLVEIKAKNIDKTFTYLVPEELESNMQIGKRVLVSFGNQKLEGFVLNINNNKYDYKLKNIISIIDEHSVINEEMMELGKYISKKTLANLISCYQTMLPRALKAKKDYVVPLKYDLYLKIIDNNYIPKNIKQKEILTLINNNEVLKKDLKNISFSSLKTLISNGIIKEIKKEVYRLNDNIIEEETNIILNNQQQECFTKVVQCLNTFKPFLLYGVTGSGKTEVYMHIMKEVLKDNKEIIVLVPEISLTPQMVDIFKKRFGHNIAILHSRLSDGEKYDEWRKIERKEVKIVIGARSAIFAPFTNLGLIIIDEEHTMTYKQENNPRYNAIDIALWRAKRYNCPLILGSATPSIESYTRAKTGIYELLVMDNRVNGSMPTVKLINMRDEYKKNRKYISEDLENAINDRLNKKEQVIILLNRRGYSTVLTCHDCGYMFKCPKCDIPLTYHKNINKMKCHYCNYEIRKVDVCPNCHKENINNFGIGTEKLEEQIRLMFKTAKTIRMDLDTTATKNAHANIISKFKNKDYDILIGTQMISKGLDFPNVTLVGVINGDASLNIPDFRSAERTFQLLNQVSGRSGRALLKGEVIIEGFNIDHYSIECASKHDYIGFYNAEMKIRKALKYPPFYNLTLIKLIGKDYKLLYEEGNKISDYLNKNSSDISVLGPSPANNFKINNNYYLQIIIKYKNTLNVIKELEYINNHYKENNKVDVQIDINPLKL